MERIFLVALIAALSAFPSVSFAWVTNLDPVTNPKTPKPAYNAANPLEAAITDPVFGTTIVRVSGDPGTNIVLNGTTDSGLKWEKEVCHNSPYGDVAWNADSSLLMLDGCDRSQTQLLDGDTFKVLRVGFENNVHGVKLWDRNDPERMFTLGSNTIYEFFPRTDRSKLLWTFDGYSNLSAQGMTRKMAHDNRRIALTAAKGRSRYNFCFDLISGWKGPDVPVDDNQSRHALISPSGKYMFARYAGGSRAGYDAFECDTGKKVFEYRGNEYPEHADTYLWNGGEYATGGGGKVRTFNLLTGVAFEATPPKSFCEHGSTRNYKDGRWMITQCGGRSKYFPLEIIAVRIDGEHKDVVRRLAHHNTYRGSNYRAEAHANVSPDGKKIVFASNWQAQTSQDDAAPVSTYVILLPDWHTPD